MYWQISLTIMPFGDQGGGGRNGSKNLCTIAMTDNDLCTCIASTTWDGPIACVHVTENVETFQSKCYHFTATKTSVAVSVMNMTKLPVARFLLIERRYNNCCPARAWFVYNRNRTVVRVERLKHLGCLGPWIFECKFRDIFSQYVWHTRQTLTK